MSYREQSEALLSFLSGGAVKIPAVPVPMVQTAAFSSRSKKTDECSL
jgi:hypothetical protein